MSPAGGLCAAAIATYYLTRLVAFPQPADDVGNWGETEGVISIVSEAVVVALSLASAASLGRPGGPGDRARAATAVA